MKQTDRVGVNAVEKIFIEQFGWIFREQAISDYGIDAHVEVTNDEEPLGRLLALQIKSGASFFKKNKVGNYVFYGKARHLRYWGRHALPVAIVLHNPETGETVWQRIEDSKIRHHKNDRWSIEIPPANVLDKSAKENLERGVSDITVYRRMRLMFDAPMMRELEGKNVFFVVEEWPNKSLGMRTTLVYFEDYVDNSPEYREERWQPTHSLGEYMAHNWPWVSYEYVEGPPFIDGSDECVGHEIRVELNEIGKAFLTLERFYEEGVEVGEDEYYGQHNDVDDEEDDWIYVDDVMIRIRDDD